MGSVHTAGIATTPSFSQISLRDFLKMSEDHFDQWEHYNFTQEKAIKSGHSGKQRTKKEASQNTNRHNPGGHERKILQKLRNAERNNLTRPQRLTKQKLDN